MKNSKKNKKKNLIKRFFENTKHMKSSRSFDILFVLNAVIFLIILFNAKNIVLHFINENVPHPELFFRGIVLSFLITLCYAFGLIIYSMKICDLKLILKKNGYEKFIVSEFLNAKTKNFFTGLDFIFLASIAYMTFIVTEGSLVLNLDLYNSESLGAVNIDKTNNYISKYVGILATIFGCTILCFSSIKVSFSYKLSYLELKYIEIYGKKKYL